MKAFIRSAPVNFVLAIFVGVLVFAPLGVRAQSGDISELLNRLDRLERDLSTMGRELARGAAPTSLGASSTAPARIVAPAQPLSKGSENTLARLDTRLNALEEEVRVATGRAESLTFRMDEILRRLDKLVADVDYRLSTLEQGGARLPKMTAAPSPPGVQRVVPGGAKPRALGAVTQGQLEGVTGASETEEFKEAKTLRREGSALPSSPSSIESAALPAADKNVLKGETPKEQYQYAFGLLRQSRYEQAEEALRAFIRLHGEDALASNARYWLGETFYVRGDHVRAAEAFLDGYQKDPKGGKASDTLLKLGMSLAALNKKSEACTTFGKMEQDFTDMSASLRKKVTRAKKQNGC